MPRTSGRCGRGELQRRIAGLLPMPPAAADGHDRGVRSLVADWFSRPFARDHAAAAVQMASSGAGRGAGGRARGEAGCDLLERRGDHGGAVCVSLGVLDAAGTRAATPTKPTAPQAERPTATATAAPHEPRPVRHGDSRRRPRVQPTSRNAPTCEHAYPRATPASPAPAGAQSRRRLRVLARLRQRPRLTGNRALDRNA